MNGKTKNKILKILKNRSYGLTIGEIANIFKIHRVTASKYLAVLEAEGRIKVREVGKAKLHYPNGKFKINMGGKSLAKIAGVLLIILISFFAVLMISVSKSSEVDITFDRRLTGEKVGQHKVPPLSQIAMKITATTSELIENGVLIDYYPSSWTIIDSSNGTISQYNSEYNKIEWSVGTIINSISRAYTILSPERTIPPTNYYFQSELAGQKSKEWRVIVSDPSTRNLTVNGIIGTWDDGGTVDYLNESDDTRGLTSGGAVVGVDFEDWNSGAWGSIQSVSGLRIWYEHAEESGFNVNFNIEVGNSTDVDVYSDNALQPITPIISADNSFTTTEAIAEEAFAYYDCPSYPTTEAGINDLQVRFVNNDGNDQAGIDVVYAEITYTSAPGDNPPTYAYNGTNVTSGSIIQKSVVIKIYANWTDDNGLNYTWYESNETGSWANSTPQALTDWSNLTIDTSGANFDKGEIFGARIFANDTGGNENYTVPTWYWTIDADPVIQNNAMINNTTAVVPSGTVVRWNVTITDDVDVNVTFFQNSTTNITATEGAGNEWYIEKTCSASGTENWTSIYANDSLDQWSSNTSVSLVWECDVNAPTVANTTVNDTEVNTSDIICVNHTASDSEGNLDQTWVQITFPNSTVVNITTSNTTGVCGSGGNIYGVEVNVGGTTGNLTINTSFANDTASQIGYQSPFPNLTVNVSAPPNTQPTIANNAFINNTSAVVGQGVSVKCNVTITDAETEPSIAFFQNDTINITASNTSSEYWIVKTCSVGEYTENWTAIYANDTTNLWTSNTSVNLSWSCDAQSPQITDGDPNITTAYWRSQANNDTTRVNCTLTDVNLDTVLIEVDRPTSSDYNSSTSLLSGNTYYVDIEVNESGSWAWACYANDSVNNWNSYDIPDTSVSEDQSPNIANDASKNKTSILDNGEAIKLNVTVTDPETSVSVVFFENQTDNITATQNGNEWYVERICSGSEYTENWDKIFANDSYNQWSSNTSVGISWDCDPVVPSITASEVNASLVALNEYVRVNCTVTDTNLDTSGILIEADKPVLASQNYTTNLLSGNTYYSDIQLNEKGAWSFKCFANDTLNHQSSLADGSTTVDNVEPKWSGNNTYPSSPVTYSSGVNYQFNITWTDNLTVNEAILEFDGTNYSYILGEISKTGNEYYKTFTDLAADNYNYRWYANDTSNNWNSTEQLIYQINKASTDINLTLNGTDTNKTYEFGEIANLTAILNVSGKTVYIDANYTGTPGQIASDTDSSVTNLTDTGNLNVSVYNITGYFSGDQNYSSNFETHYMTVQDTEKPQYSNLKNTSAVYNQDFQANTTWTENYQLDKVLFESNYTGTLMNYTVTTYSGSEYYYTILGGNQTTDKIVVWKWYANDTSNNMNYTSQFNYTAGKAPTEMKLWLNGTRGNKGYINNTYANFTAQLNVSGKTINLTSNMTGFGTISNATSVIYNITHLKETGVFNMTAYWDGDDNYTADSETWYATVSTQNMQTNFTMSPTSINQEENSTVSANCTCVGGTCTNSFIEIQADGSLIPNVSGYNLQVNGSSAYNLGTIGDGDTKNASWNITGHNAGTYAIRIKCNSTETGDSFSTTQNLQVNDTTKPTWSNNQTDIVTTYSSTTLSYFNITWTDNVEIDKVFIEGDWSGSPQNYTMLNYSSVYSYNETLPVGSFYWKSYANDTSNNWNVSDTWYFTIIKAPTSTRLFLNGTENDTNYNRSDIANLTATVNITGKNVQLWIDFTGTMQNISNSPGTTPLTNITDTSNLNLSIYNITAYFAEDQNYTESSVSYQMEVYKGVKFNGTMKDASGNPVNAIIKIYKPDTNEEVGNVSTNATGHYNKTFNSTGFHDVLIEVFNDSIKLLRANLSENAIDTLALDNVLIENITIPATRFIHKGLSASINLTYQNVTVCLNYTLATIQYENTIKIFRCQDWNFTYRSCNATWSKLGGVINTTSDTICINQTNFSAYAAAEAIECGNGVCESGESCSSCSQDCGGCAAAPTGGEGPSGGVVEGIVPEAEVTPNIEIIVDEHIQIMQGDEKLVNVFIKNTGNATLHNVSLQIKGVEEYWREIWDQNLNVSINESITIRVMFRIPSDALAKKYSVEFIVSSSEITDSEILILEIKPKSLLMERFDELSKSIKAKIDRFLGLMEIMKEKGIPTGLSKELLLKARSVFWSAVKLKELGNYTGAIALLEKTDVVLNTTSSSLEEVITTEFGRLVLMIKLTLSFTLVIVGILIYDKRKKIIRAFNTVFNLISKRFKRVPKPLYEKPKIPEVEVPEEVPKIEKKIPEIKPRKFKMPKIRLPRIKVKIPKIKMPKVKVRIPEIKPPRIEKPKFKPPRIKVPKIRVPKIRVKIPKIKLPRIKLKTPETGRLKLKVHKVMMKIEEAAKKEVKIPEIKLPKLRIPRVKVRVPGIKPPKIKEVEGVMKIKLPKVSKIKKNIPEVKPLKFKMPRVKLPKITVKIPKFKIPRIKVPEIRAPKIGVKIPKIKLPRIKVKTPEIKIPKLKIPKPPRIKVPKIKVPKVRIPKVKIRKVEGVMKTEVKKISRLRIPKIGIKVPKIKTPKVPKIKIRLKIPRMKIKIPKKEISKTLKRMKTNIKKDVNTILDYIVRKRKRKRK